MLERFVIADKSGAAVAYTVLQQTFKHATLPLGTEVVKYADAQATIAALQARVQELESNRVPNSMQHVIELQAMNNRLGVRVETLESQLTQRTAERDTARRRVDELEAREVDVALLRGDLEKRTAELETVTRERDEAAKDRDDWITSWRALQRHNERIEAELERVRSLIKALPRMEGEITCSQQFDSAWRLQYWQVEAYGVADECLYRLSNLRKEEANAYAALLKHRQRMEG